jgi:tetratricopeptide (TPR) repeat protein
MGFLQSFTRLPLLHKLFRNQDDVAEPAPSRATTSCAEIRSLLEQGNFDEAEQACRSLLNLYPDSLEGLTLAFQLALLHGAGRSALRFLENGVRLRPDTAELSFMLGYLHLQNGNIEVAVTHLNRTLELDPQSAKACNSLGVAMQLGGRNDEALRYYQKTHEIDPHFWRASYNIGNMTKLYGRFADAVGPFQQAMFARRGFDAQRDVIDLDDPLVTLSKLAHDAEQLEYLARQNLLDQRGRTAQQALSEALKAADIEFGTPLSRIPEPLHGKLAPYYNRLFHFYSAPALPEGALDQNQDWDAIAKAYFDNGPGMIYFDNFLKPEALESLRRFCLESTIWFDFLYGAGYVGCTCEDGFISPLLAQIAEETRLALTKVIGNHRLNGLWGYKYDSEQSGIAAHADFAAVNVNFWLTPDEANLSPENGGLVVWDKEAPLDWDFEDYNSKPGLIAEFLESTGAQPYVVPHRQNRVVLFNSNLFHRTDDYRFKPGYENRRINVTMLYGDRQAPKS